MNSNYKFSYIFILASVNLLSLFINKINADNLDQKNTSFRNSIENNFLKNKKINSFQSSYKLVEKNNFEQMIKKNIAKYNNQIINLLAFNQDNNLGNVEIESNIQYQRDNIFYAEGNVIIFFSNAELKGDKVRFDRDRKDFTIEGNVIIKKGEQYLEANKIVYNLKKNEGYIDDAYGVLDFINIEEDLEINNEIDRVDLTRIRNIGKEIRDLSYISTTTIGLANDFEEKRKFNIKDLDFSIPSINKWRFKSKKILLQSESLFANKIYFSNDPFNKPQFVLMSKNFSGEIIKDKIKFTGRNNWVILDNKIKFPIGRQTIIDKDPISKWGIGSDYKEKDGFYLSRTFEDINIFDNLQMRLTPYFLLQRYLKGKSDSFRAPGSSILSNKVKNEITFLDNFALDANFTGKLNSWKFKMNNSFNTLNSDRLSESLRSKLTLEKSYDLNRLDLQKDSLNLDIEKENKKIDNFLDLQFYSVFREKVLKGYDGEEEIYFANGLSVANKKSSEINEVLSGSSLIFDFGEFKAKRKDSDILDTLSRSAFAYTYSYRYPIWKKKIKQKEITKDYIFTPEILTPSIYWNTQIDSGIFFYSDSNTQKALSISSGASWTIGDLKKYFFDYTKLSANFTHVFKGGDSPFAFDDINNDTRLQINFKQQLFGPLMLSYESYIPLESTNSKYGTFTNKKYRLDFERRAYKIGAYYSEEDEVFGVQFQLHNFDYAGVNPKF